VRRVQQVVQTSRKLLCPLSHSHGQHDLRRLQQGHVQPGSLQKAHDQTPGQDFVRKMQSDVCIKSGTKRTPADFQVWKIV